MRRLTVLLSVFLVAVVVGPGVVNAEEVKAVPLPSDLIIDPSIPTDPVFTLKDPCLTSDFELELGKVNWKDTETGTDFFVSEAIIELKNSAGTGIGQVISKYSRITADSTEYVALDDTMIFPEALTIFGQASNVELGHIGARGAGTRIVDSNGQIIDVDLTYLYSDYGGTDSICFWIGE